MPTSLSLLSSKALTYLSLSNSFSFSANGTQSWRFSCSNIRCQYRLLSFSEVGLNKYVFILKWVQKDFKLSYTILKMTFDIHLKWSIWDTCRLVPEFKFDRHLCKWDCVDNIMFYLSLVSSWSCLALLCQSLTNFVFKLCGAQQLLSLVSNLHSGNTQKYTVGVI